MKHPKMGKVYVDEVHKMPGKKSIAPKTIDLDKPSDAREFLSHFKVDGRKVSGIETTGQKWIEFTDMDDSQIVFYAKEIYFDWLGGKEGQDMVVDTNIDRGMN